MTGRLPARPRPHRRRVAIVQRMIASYVDARFTALGADGFGRSDTRQALRAFFEVDRYHIVIAALNSIAAESVIAPDVVASAIERYNLKRSSSAALEHLARNSRSDSPVSRLDGGERMPTKPVSDTIPC